MIFLVDNVSLDKAFVKGIAADLMASMYDADDEDDLCSFTLLLILGVAPLFIFHLF